MPIKVGTPSFSAIRANDKPVYLNSEGAIKTGRSLKGRLVGIAESLGIFKDYVTSYREREVAHNRDAYDAAWRFVSNKYGAVANRYTQESMKHQGYSRAVPFSYIGRRLQGHDAHDPERAIVGRELRLILDTARGVNEDLWENDVASQEDVDVAVGRMSQNSEEKAEQKLRKEVWTGLEQSGEEVAEVSTLGVQGYEDESNPAQIPRELGRAMVANNKERLQQMLGGETQIRKLAQELGYDPKAIASRHSYILGKLEKRIEADPRAKSGRLTSNEILELAHVVFDKALGKSKMVVGIRGAMLGVSSKVKRALVEDNPGQVDILELSKDKIKAGTRDRKYLKKLMVERLGSQDKEIYATRIRYIEHLAIKEATVRVRETKVELSHAEVDDVLTHALRKSFEVGQYKAWMRGGLGKASRAVKPELYGLKRSAEDVLEKAADENPRTRAEEAPDEQPKALPETQQQPEQPEQLGQASSPAAVATPSPALPKPQKYKGVDYFDQSDKGIRRLAFPVRNHQAAKQVVTDDRYLAASVPKGHSGDELSIEHREYIKTTLLRHVDVHERTNPGTLLDAGDLHRMMMPITARALRIQGGRKLRAKVLYKNVSKHLGHKDVAFGDELKKLRRNARVTAGAKAGLLSFVRGAARKANITIDIDHNVLKTIRPQVRDMAEAYVNERRKVFTDAELEDFVQIALNGYSLVAAHAPAPMRDFKW